MTMKLYPKQYPSQRGFSMVEVLVAIVITSLGMLGVAGLQAMSLRASSGALYRAQAALYANDMADRMRANQGDARNYVFAKGASKPSGTTVRDRDLADWVDRLATLPAGVGSVEVDTTTNEVTITVQWNDTRAGGPSNANFILTTRLWNR
jgi:type IV pilus assembly protein PilV